MTTMTPQEREATWAALELAEQTGDKKGLKAARKLLNIKGPLIENEWLHEKMMLFVLRVINRFNLGGEYTTAVKDTLRRYNKS